MRAKWGESKNGRWNGIDPKGESYCIMKKGKSVSIHPPPKRSIIDQISLKEGKEERECEPRGK